MYTHSRNTIAYTIQCYMAILLMNRYWKGEFKYVVIIVRCWYWFDMEMVPRSRTCNTSLITRLSNRVFLRYLNEKRVAILRKVNIINIISQSESTSPSQII